MIFEKIKEILCDEMDLNPADITEDANVIDDLGLDSLDLANLVTEIEDEFNITVKDEDLEGVTTIGGFVEYVESLVD